MDYQITCCSARGKNKKPKSAIGTSMVRAGSQLPAKMKAQIVARPILGWGILRTAMADQLGVDHVNFVRGQFADAVSDAMHTLQTISHHRVKLSNGDYGARVSVDKIAATEQDISTVCRLFDDCCTICTNSRLLFALKVMVAQEIDELLNLATRLVEFVHPILKFGAFDTANFAHYLQFGVEKCNSKFVWSRSGGAIQHFFQFSYRKTGIGIRHSARPLFPAFQARNLTIAVEQSVNILFSPNEMRCSNWLINGVARVVNEY